MKRGRIFFITGPTAAGKTIIINYLLKHRAKTTKVISYTTRDKRNGEIDCKDYFFVNKKQFRILIKTKKLIEYARVYGEFYGTGRDSFKAINQGYDVIKLIDYKGAKKFKKLIPDAIFLFFAPKNINTLKKRLKERGDQDIKARLKVYKKELQFKKECDYYIDTSGNTNEDIKSKALEVIKIMNYVNKGHKTRNKAYIK